VIVSGFLPPVTWTFPATTPPAITFAEFSDTDSSVPPPNSLPMSPMRRSVRDPFASMSRGAAAPADSLTGGVGAASRNRGDASRAALVLALLCGPCMELRHASSIVPDHTFARRLAVVTGLLTAVAIGGAVGVMISHDDTPAAAALPVETLRDHKLRYAQWEIDKYVELAFPRWAAGHPAGACPKNLVEVNAFVPDLHAVDRWGVPYQFFCTQGVFSVRAAGMDRAYDTSDDLASKAP
jgi:hypothetical protein